MIAVSFVDTSILCNLIPVPGRDQDRSEVTAEMLDKQKSHEVLILPVTALIETGNFIAQISDGDARRKTAKIFEELLQLVIKNKAPWRLHQFTWGAEFLDSFIAGGGTGIRFVDHATRALGGGDLCILTERDLYRTRTGIPVVNIWTRDTALAAHS